MSTLPHEGPEGAKDEVPTDAPPPSESLPRDELPTDAPPPSRAATQDAGEGLGDLRQALREEDLRTASLAELLFYAVADEGEDGTDAILRAARDELRALARLAISSDDGESLLSHAELGGALDGIVRRLDVVIELNERAAVAERAARAEVSAP